MPDPLPRSAEHGHLAPRPDKAAIKQARNAHRAHRGAIPPPEWDIGADYYCNLWNTGFHASSFLGLLAAASLFPLIVAFEDEFAGFLSGPALPIFAILFVVAVPVSVLAAVLVMRMTYEMVMGRRLDRARLVGLDPTQALNPEPLDDNLQTLLFAVARVDHQWTGKPVLSVPAERRSRLLLAYQATARLLAHAEETKDASFRSSVKHCRDVVTALVEQGTRAPASSREKWAAERVQERMSEIPDPEAVILPAPVFGPTPGWYPEEPDTDHGIHAAAASPIPRPSTRPARSEADRLRDRWADAVRTHDRVAEEWGALASDPLTALTHSALFDVTQPRTAAFIEAYGEAQDLRSLRGSDFPTGTDSHRVETMVREYATAARKTDTTWAEALRYAEHVTFDWLPPTEADAARRAAAFLVVAADEAATFPERAAAAAKAADLLKKVTSFLLPPKALDALEEQTRLELP